ncbi:MAG: IS110 family transposase [Candidatus Acidiferrum sp.]
MKKQAQAYYVAIDLHSNNLLAAIVDAQGRRLKQARLFCELHEVEKFLQPYRAKIAAIALESTFNWYWLADGLQDLGYHVVLANPAALVQYDGLKHADDKSDAFFLAELLRLGILPAGYILERKLRAVRDLLRRRASLVAQRTALTLSLRNLQLRTKGYCPMPTSRLQHGERQEVVDLFAEPAEKMTAEIQKTHIDALGRSIARIEKHVQQSARQLPHGTQLTSVPGIGKILAMTILLEVGDIARFPSAENFASYARMVKAARTSNGKKKGENNAKCGNRYLAWAFIEASHFIRRYDERAARWHARKTARSNKIIATKALGCKLAKTVWYILASGCEYDGERLFGPGKSRGSAAAAQENFGRASASQKKGLKQPVRGLIGGRCSPSKSLA